MAFTCTSLPLKLNTFCFSDAVVVSDLNKNFGGSTDLAKKRHGSADLHTPIQPTLQEYSDTHCYVTYCDLLS